MSAAPFMFAGLTNDEDGVKLNYHVRAQLHAPRTREEIQGAAQQLAAQGFSDHTIAAILKIDVNGIRTILGPRKPV